MNQRRNDATDITGEKFNFLTAIKYVGLDRNSNSIWLFQCDCGNSKSMMLQNVTKKKEPIKSCGCLYKRHHIEITKSPSIQRVLAKVFSQYKKRAAYKNLNFNLTKEQFADLVQLPCIYCGITGVNERESFRYNGIDRVDNFKGYELDNSVPCCKYCNQMKSDLTIQEFKDRIEHLYMHLRKNHSK